MNACTSHCYRRTTVLIHNRSRSISQQGGWSAFWALDDHAFHASLVMSELYLFFSLYAVFVYGDFGAATSIHLYSLLMMSILAVMLFSYSVTVRCAVLACWLSSPDPFAHCAHIVVLQVTHYCIMLCSPPNQDGACIILSRCLAFELPLDMSGVLC